MNTHGGAAACVAARISYDLRDSIDEAAARSRLTRSEYVRNVLKLLITAERACQPERVA
jgi:uncharacterized protein (DUF1778 family)